MTLEREREYGKDSFEKGKGRRRNRRHSCETFSSSKYIEGKGIVESRLLLRDHWIYCMAVLLREKEMKRQYFSNI